MVCGLGPLMQVVLLTTDLDLTTVSLDRAVDQTYDAFRLLKADGSITGINADRVRRFESVHGRDLSADETRDWLGVAVRVP